MSTSIKIEFLAMARPNRDTRAMHEPKQRTETAYLLTDPASKRTPFGDTKMPEPMIDPTIIPTPFISPIFRFNLTLESEEESEVLPFGDWFPCSTSTGLSVDILVGFCGESQQKWTDFPHSHQT